MEQEKLKQLWTDLKSKSAEVRQLWDDISKYVGITVSPTYKTAANGRTGSENVDQHVDDPTAALSVIQAGDYLDGILWGTGEHAVTLEPADELLREADASSLSPYYEFRTEQLLKNMNHSGAGFSAARKPYFYDQVGYGTSGIGAFINGKYVEGVDDNPYIFRSFGVDSSCIDEGANGRVEIIFNVYNWRVSRIIDEFGEDAPECVVKDYEAGNYNKEHQLIQGIYPRSMFNPGKKGKLGTKYEAKWFVDEDVSTVFYTEDFRTMPIGMCRAIKVRGEVYGRSSGSLLIQSIKSVNYMFTQAMENIEKRNNPPLGTFSNAIFGDSVVDTSAGGMVEFNADFSGGANPMFRLYDEGDPTGLIQFLIPYLNEKIATGFKVDILLDFSSESEKTATEMMQRYAIRGKALSGIIGQQIDECFVPLVKRCVQIEDDLGLTGIDARLDPEQAQQMREVGRSNIIIPEPVARAMDEGRPWYKIRFNNELNRLSKTEVIEKALQLLNAVGAVSQLYPDIVQAIDWYDLISDINEALGFNYIKDKDEFIAILTQRAQQSQQQALLEAGQAAGDIAQKLGKAQSEVVNAQR